MSINIKFKNSLKALQQLLTKVATLVLLLSACTCSHKSSLVKYKICFDTQWTSFENGGRQVQLQAFVTELIEEIAKSQKTAIEVYGRNWNNLYEGLEKKECDAIVSNLNPYSFNEKKYLFSDSFLETGPILVTRAQSTVTSLTDLADKKVGIQKNMSTELVFVNYPDITLIPCDSYSQALSDVHAGVLEAAVVSSLTAKAYCSGLYQGTLRAVARPLNQEGLKIIALCSDDSKLIPLFNAGLLELKKNGVYDDLCRKWNLL